MSNTGIPKVNVAVGASSDEQPEVDISDEEFLQFDTSAVPVIITLTKVAQVHSLLVAGWEALYCGCNFRRGIPNELGCLCVC